MRSLEMPTITLPAAMRLKRLFERAQLEENDSVRLRATTHGLEMFFDSPRPGDDRVVYRNRTLFLLDPPTARRLAGRRIDLEVTEAGEALVVA
jgi:Fe-S cluster assembly iron-binding protein IscA